MSKNKKKRRWIYARHAVVRNIIYGPLYLCTKLRYQIEIGKIKGFEQQPCLILFNHQTAFDQFFVSCAFPKHVYYVSSEDLFSNGWISRLLSWAVAPIPFRKSTSDLTGVKNCMRVAKEGGTIAMAPEGNRTYSGVTGHMKSSVAALAKALKLPIVLYRIEGGYGIHPRWSDKVRRGKMKAYVSRVVWPEEYKEMSKEELFEIIAQGLYVDETTDKRKFYSKSHAEYLERAMYVCPHCGLTEFETKKDLITCKSCHRQVRYLPTKELKGVDFSFPYRYVKDWYDAQCEFVHRLDMSEYLASPIYSDQASYSLNVYCKRKVVLEENATLQVYGDRFLVKTAKEEIVYPFEKVSAASVLGKNKLNLYVDDQAYQFKGDKHFNALKYMNLYYHARNAEKEGEDGRFLGV